jgi:hypothetical protein
LPTYTSHFFLETATGPGQGYGPEGPDGATNQSIFNPYFVTNHEWQFFPSRRPKVLPFRISLSISKYGLKGK